MSNGHYGFTAIQEHIFQQMMHRMESTQMKERLDIQSPDDQFRLFWSTPSPGARRPKTAETGGSSANSSLPWAPQPPCG